MDELLAWDRDLFVQIHTDLHALSAEVLTELLRFCNQLGNGWAALPIYGCPSTVC